MKYLRSAISVLPLVVVACTGNTPSKSDAVAAVQNRFAGCISVFTTSDYEKNNGYVDPKNPNQYIIELSYKVKIVKNISDGDVRLSGSCYSMYQIGQQQINTSGALPVGTTWEATSTLPLHKTENGWML